MILGDADRAPSPPELDRMRVLVAQAMEDGAMGLSTSLQYAPAPYAKTAELVALAAESAQRGGIYATHMRSEGDAILPAIDEALAIARQAKTAVEIWHLKAAGKKNWGRMPEIVAKIDAARREGLDVTADTYAYPAWFNTFSAFIPPWAHDGGDAKLIERLRDPATRARIRHDMEHPDGTWDDEWDEIPGPEAILVSVVQNPELRPLQGKTLAQVAKLWKKDPIDALCDLLIADHAFTEVAVFGMSEPDVALALIQPWVSIDNDSQGTAPDGILGREHPHPRAYGTFPRILRKYVREEGKLRLEEAIRKFSALPARPPRPRRPRRAQGRHVGRPRRLRPRHHPRPRDLREPQPARGRDGLRAGQRRPGDRRRQGDRRVAGEGAAGTGVEGTVACERSVDQRSRTRRSPASIRSMSRVGRVPTHSDKIL